MAIRKAFYGIVACAMLLAAHDARAQSTPEISDATSNRPATSPNAARPPAIYFDPLSLMPVAGRWYVVGYGGVMAQNKLSSIVRFDANLQQDPVFAAGIGNEWGAVAPWLRLEWEANVGVRAEGGATIVDLRWMLGARLTDLPWNHVVHTSFAVMTGPSWLTAPSWQYESRQGQTMRISNGMVFEFTIGPPAEGLAPPVQAMFRIQHRSPLFGVAGTASPSDAVMAGLQFRF